MALVTATYSFPISGTTFEDVCVKVLAQCKLLGILDPTNVELIPVGESRGKSIPSEWEATVRYSVTKTPTLKADQG